MRLWVDTDVGTDPDDAIALLCAVAHPDVELVGVSTVDDPTGARAQVAHDLVGEVPVTIGTLLDPEGFAACDPDAVLAIGPLTNIARLVRSGQLPRRLAVMGGALGPVRHLVWPSVRRVEIFDGFGNPGWTSVVQGGMTLPRHVTAFAVAVTLGAACGSDSAQDQGSTSSTGSSSGAVVEITSAEYTCGATDGDVIALVLRAEAPMDVMASLVVDGVSAGESSPVTLAANVDMPVSFDAVLTDETYSRGGGDVQIFELDDQGTRGQVLAEKHVPLRFPEGVACG